MQTIPLYPESYSAIDLPKNPRLSIHLLHPLLIKGVHHLTNEGLDNGDKKELNHNILTPLPLLKFH